MEKMAFKHKKTAVIGCGRFGQAHARVLHEISNLVAVVDKNESRAKELATLYHCNSYTDYHLMIEKEKPDAVSIVLPPKIMPIVTQDIVKEGIDVLIEKPMALSTDPLKEILKISQKNNVYVMVGFIELFNPVMDVARDAFNNKTNQYLNPGKVISITARRFGVIPKRAWETSVMLDLGIHDLYILDALIGPLEKNVTSIAVSSASTGNEEDQVSVLMKTKNGINVLMESNWIGYYKERTLTLYGTKNIIVIDFLHKAYKILKGINTEIPATEIMAHSYLSPPEPLKRELMAFLSRDENAPLLSYGIKILRLALEILDTARKSKNEVSVIKIHS